MIKGDAFNQYTKTDNTPQLNLTWQKLTHLMEAEGWGGFQRDHPNRNERNYAKKSRPAGSNSKRVYMHPDTDREDIIRGYRVITSAPATESEYDQVAEDDDFEDLM